MTTDRRAYIREYMRQHRAAGQYKDQRTGSRRTPERIASVRAAGRKYAKAHRGEPAMLTWPFWGCDGEGAGQGTEHIYWLLRIGPHVLAHEDGSDLTTQECLMFLADIGASKPKAIPVAFFFGYDTTMILRGLPHRAMQRLLAPSLVCWQCGHIKDHHVPNGPCITTGQDGCKCDCERFLGGGSAFFTPVVKGRPGIRPIVVSQQGSSFSVKWQGKPALVISDTAGFFQTSFIKTLERWEIRTAEQLTEMAHMKDQRGAFTIGEDLEEVKLYNAEECALLAELMGKLREACTALGIVPRRWQGAGWLASAMLERANVPKRHELDIPPQVQGLGELAYFGGRFEPFQFGSFTNVDSWDIASAYPHAYTGLPCLVKGHGTWRQVAWEERTTDAGIWPAAFASEAPVFLAPLPHRDPTGRISFPAVAHGWYWGVEITAAERYCKRWLKRGTFQAGGSLGPGWEWHQDCADKPGAFAEHWYYERLKWGKGARGIVLKLALNSLYGKAAQRIGRPAWANIVWAGMITATTRARLLDAARQLGPSHVVSFQTDGLYSTKGALPGAVEAGTGAALGQWEHQATSDLFLAQSGVYATRGTPDDPWACHSRGFPFRAMLEVLPELQARFPVEGWSLVVDLPPRPSFVGMRLGADRGAWATIGTWEDMPRCIDFGANADKRWLLPNGKTLALPAAPGYAELADSTRGLSLPDSGSGSAPYDEQMVLAISEALSKVDAVLVHPYGPEGEP